MTRNLKTSQTHQQTTTGEGMQTHQQTTTGEGMRRSRIKRQNLNLTQKELEPYQYQTKGSWRRKWEQRRPKELKQVNPIILSELKGHR